MKTKYLENLKGIPPSTLWKPPLKVTASPPWTLWKPPKGTPPPLTPWEPTVLYQPFLRYSFMKILGAPTVKKKDALFTLPCLP